MADTQRSDHVKALVDENYGYAMEQYDLEPTVYDQIFKTRPSSLAYEQDTTAVAAGKLRETAESETIKSTTATEGFTVYTKNKKFTDKLPISNEAIDDNTKFDNFLREWQGSWGEGARLTKEEHHADTFNKGALTAGHAVFNNEISGGVLSTGYSDPNLPYDGVPFFNLTGNTRTAKHGGTYYNAVADLDLNETNLEVLYKLLSRTNAYNERGNKIRIRPNVIVVQEGSTNMFTAQRIVQSAAQVSGSHSGIANLWAGMEVLPWWAIDDTNADAWWLGVKGKGLLSTNRMPLMFDVYEDKDSDGQVIRARIRFGSSVQNFRFWAGANVVTS